jgi:predicted phage baseplate assembly protein
MSLPVPNLDDRTFQDLVNEARLRIPQICPEWTDHNVSDPGIALIELFAWMTESLIYRANQVPDKNYVKFMELVGIKLRPAVPAQTDVTFKLTAPREQPTHIPSGTEVATVRTETEEAIVFSTTSSLNIIPPTLEDFYLTRDNIEFRQRIDLIDDWNQLRTMGIDPGLQGGGDSFPVFEQAPETNNTFYLGYAEDLSGIVLAIDLDCVEAEGSGVNPNNPPIHWEYWDSYYTQWIAFGRSENIDAWLELDATRGLNIPGRIILHIPRTSGLTYVNGVEKFWIRCACSEPEERQGQYVTSPQIKSITSSSIGGVCPASNYTWSYDEVLGNSNGRPSQSFKLYNSPVLNLHPGEPIEVQREDGEGWETWDIVEDFSNSTGDDMHVVCDAAFSEITFGPIIKSSGRSERHYGAIPNTGLQIRIPAYKYGGGPIGNIGSKTLTVLKSSIPYVSDVTNRMPAGGGKDAESLDEGRLRTPNVFKTRNRAVTKEDYEFLAKEASTGIAKAHCVEPILGIQNSPLPAHAVQLLLVPQIALESNRPDVSSLTVSQQVKERVTEYLDARRLIGTPLIVTDAQYIEVGLEVLVKLLPGSNQAVAINEIQDLLYSYIHPGIGGESQTGWEFGKDLYIPEIISRIQTVPEVEYTLEINAFKMDSVSGERSEPLQHIEVSLTETLCSGTHFITCI